jgi:hypothetical protein
MAVKKPKKLTWHNDKAKLKDLVPCSYNPRMLTKKQYADLKLSLEKFDLAEVPAIDTDNKIIAGHQRITVLIDLYGKNHEIDIRKPNRKLTKKEFDEYLTRSNKNTGSWDFEILANQFELGDLVEWGFDGRDLDIDITAEQESGESSENDKGDYCKTCGKRIDEIDK